MSRRSPPLGVAILCVLDGLGTLLNVANGLAGRGSLLVAVLGGAVNVALLWGLWTGRSWAWKITMVLWGLAAVLLFLVGFVGASGVALAAGAITLGLMAYLGSKMNYYTTGGESQSFDDDKDLGEIRA